MLGKRIREVRMKVGLNSSVVSDYLGLDLKLYLLIENDGIFVNYEILSKLCLLFGCNESVLMNNGTIECISLENMDIHKINELVHFRKVCNQYL